MINNVHEIHHVNQQKSFTEDDAYKIVDLLLIITSKSKNRINALNAKLDIFKNNFETSEKIQVELNQEVQRWSEKVRRLGAIPSALYKVKISGLNCHYTWEFPSADIEIHAN